MKYPNHVTTEYVHFTEEEIKNIKSHVLSLAKKAFPDVISVTYKNAMTIPGIAVYVNRPVRSGRNSKKVRIFNAGSVGILFYKTKGYLEVKNGETDPNRFYHDFDNAPEFQYSASLFCEGSECRFRCRNKQSIQMREESPFKYGTELSDLDYSNLFRLINEYTKVVK